MGVVGPVFQDGRFEYVPLLNEYGSDKPTYSDWPARNKDYGETLADFIPPKYRGSTVHCDPEFEHFTYGQHAGEYIRVRELERLKEGDILFFLASLAPYDVVVYSRDDIPLKAFQTGKKNKYVIGYFTIRGVAHAEVVNSSKVLTTALRHVYYTQERGEPSFDVEDIIDELTTLSEYGYIRIEEDGYRLTSTGKKLVNDFLQNGMMGDTKLVENGNIEIKIHSGQVSDVDVRNNDHYRSLLPLDFSRFLIVVGDPENSRLLHQAIRLTDHYETNTFRLNSLGRHIRGRETDVLRGTRRLDEEQTRVLMTAIISDNVKERDA